MELSALPSEIIEEILTHAEPKDLGQVAQASSLFNKLINHADDSHLWRRVYLSQSLDDPRVCVSLAGHPKEQVDWRKDMQDAEHAMNLLKAISLTTQDRIRVERTLLSLASTVPLLSSVPADSFADGGSTTSQNLIRVAAALRGGSFFDTAPATIFSASALQQGDPEQVELQLRSRLHTLFGLTPADVQPPAQAASRGIVYAMRNYTFDNYFGPFLPSTLSDLDVGEDAIKVNWVHLQAIHHVVSTHVVELEELAREYFEFAVYPISLPFTQIRDFRRDFREEEEKRDPDQEEEDWAGVSGRWKCSFCFIDHRELLKYNNLGNTKIPLDTSIFTTPDFHEVFRTIDIQFSIMSRADTIQRKETDDYSLFGDSSTNPDPGVKAKRPYRKIHFAGVVSGSPTMSGWVGMTEEGFVRWHFVSGEEGNAVWSSEGIQIGGLRSKSGVLGSWTTIFHDEDDPVGE